LPEGDPHRRRAGDHFLLGDLPKSLLAKIAGVGVCSDGAIEAAKHRSGQAELANPSCPESAKIGRTMAGYGVGGVLAWAPATSISLSPTFPR
jgi:hypothetical protein